jgi:hypothetical protein
MVAPEDFIAGDPSEEEKLEQWKQFFDGMAAKQDKKAAPN